MWSQSSIPNVSPRKSGLMGKSDDDSGVVDSGFCSDNLLVSNDISEDIDVPLRLDDQEKVTDNNQAITSMRVDSGVDIGISDSLSQLSLTNPGFNHLGDRFKSDRVQTEPELEPIVVKADEARENSGHIEAWQLYYIQDSDGDT